jgi:multidrug efflux pump subunit AcrA (membrane-fusion protein)
MNGRNAIVFVLLLLAGAGGWWANARFGDGRPAEGGGPCPGGAQPEYWRAPMDPTYVRDEPGKSPMGMDLVPVCPGPGAQGAAGPAAGEVRVDPSVVQSIGVRTAGVERGDLTRRIRTVGRVAWDERRVAHVHTKVQGWVEQLHVQYRGQQVERGQPLLEIYSPDLVSTQEELLIAARYRDATASSPVEDVRRGGASMFKATRRRLELWDIPEPVIERLLETGTIRKTLTLVAPASGVVIDLRVREGMEVGPAQNLYTIADLSRVWVLADIYENELPWVEVGRHGRVELAYLPGRTFHGMTTYIDPFLDPETRTARVRLELENPEGVLKPDMFADVTLDSETRQDVLIIPDEAVIRSGTRNLAIVALGEGRFRPREVEIGLDSGDGRVEVRDGLAEGEQVVVSGQFLIDSESRLQEAVQKLLTAPAAEGGGHPMPGGSGGHEGHEMPGDSGGHQGHEMPAAEGTE